MSRRSPSPTPSHSPDLNSATHSSTTTSTAGSSLYSPIPASSPMSDEDDAIPPPNSTSPPPTTAGNSLPTSTRTPSFPVREDCWSEAATHTLIEAWGSHYIELNRGNLRQKQWQEVANAVNALHAHTKKLHRTDIQCKNRIDTLKKKYKVEKAKFVESDGHYVSPWPFFSSLNSLIGDFSKSNPLSNSPSYTRKSSNSAPAPVRKDFLALPPPPSMVPVGPRSKRPAHGMVHLEDVGFRRKFPPTGAVAARAGRGEEEDDEESETSSGAANGIRRRKRRRVVEDEVGVKGYGQLAEAIGKFGEIYERVEEAKQRQMIELEKQRMQFAKDLEIQRMKLFMESQLQLEKLKRSKHRSRADEYCK